LFWWNIGKANSLIWLFRIRDWVFVKTCGEQLVIEKYKHKREYCRESNSLHLCHHSKETIEYIPNYDRNWTFKFFSPKKANNIVIEKCINFQNFTVKCQIYSFLDCKIWSFIVLKISLFLQLRFSFFLEIGSEFSKG